MKEESFYGNCYLYFPCEIDPQKIKIKSTQYSNFVTSYLEAYQKYFPDEINASVHDNITRIYIDCIDFMYLDSKESEENSLLQGDVFLSYDIDTKLSVLVVAFFNCENVQISHLLDRVSQNEFIITLNDKRIDFKSYLQSININQLNHGKVCLSATNEVQEELFAYYMCNETYNSKFMSAQILESKYNNKIIKNIAHYNSSDIYANTNSILRIDKRDYKSDVKNRIESDILFLFIIEILLFKESAIERTNNKIIKSLSSNKQIMLYELNDIMSEFSKTMPLWNTNIFKYITAQNLANEIESTFLIENKFKKYTQNQKLLQDKINIKQSISMEKENKLLFLIAIILFVFEVYNLLKDFADKTTSFSISTILFFILIFFIKRNRKNE